MSRRTWLIALGAALAWVLASLPAAAASTQPAAAAPAPETPAAGAPLQIGIVGTGRIGSALARHWARAGHALMLSSRHPEQLRGLAAELGSQVRVGTPQQAAAFGSVLLFAVPYAALPALGDELRPELAGKIIIDASNPIERRDGPMALEMQRQGAGVASAGLLHSKRLVRAFNCIGYAQIASDAFRQPQRRVIPIGGDDAEALRAAERLVRDAGFEPWSIGSLARTRLFDLGQPLASKDWTASQYQAELARQ